VRNFLSGLAVGLTLAAAATAFATARGDAYLKRGDTASAVGGETACTVQSHGGSRNGFVCRVGGDYRAKYGVIVNEREVAITRYVAFNRYRVTIRRAQSPLP
jgi:hypothetical protein